MKHPSQSIQFERRDILKLIAGGPGAALISRAPLASAAAIAVPEPSASPTSPSAYQPKTFNPHEWKTIHVLCDSMIPADQISASASQVGVPQFIDDWLDFKRGNLPAQIQGGLTWLDTE